jgi:hypothetical protein
MSQVGFTPISTYYTTTAAAVPTAGNLVNGELALNINTADGKLFYKDSAGVVQVLASKDANAGNFTNISVSGVASFADGTVSAPSITNIGDTNTGIFFPAADTIAFSEGGVESMRIDASGNVGIGVSSPVRRLDLAGTSLNGIGIINTNSGNGSYFSLSSYGSTGDSVTGWPNSNVFESVPASGGNFVFSAFGSAMVFQTGSGRVERMRIDSSGNVGIGTSSPSVKLQLQSGVFHITDGTQTLRQGVTTGLGFVGMQSNHPLVLFTNDVERMRILGGGEICIAGTNQRSAGLVNIDVNPSFYNGISFYPTSNSAIDACRFLNNSGTIVGTIQSNASATLYNTSSDYRLKENIAPMTGALAIVAALKPVTYNWKVDGSDGQGFIAHELQSVVPDCVTGEKDAVDAKGNPVYQGIDTSFLVATLTAAIQELNAKLDAQAARIAALESK